MSEPVLKQRSTIDLDDFERRLRQASAAGGRGEDPLAELARLVGEPYDPLRDVFAREATAGRPGDTGSFADAAYPAGPYDGDHHASGRREPGLADGIPRLFGDFAAIEAGLRGNAQPHGAPSPHGQFAQGHAQGQPAFDPSFGAETAPPALEGGEWAGPADGWDARQGSRDAEASRTRRPMMMMAASIAIGVLGIGTAFALKGRVSSSPREIKTIMADASPTKVQPPPDAAPEAGGDGVAFGKAGGAAPAKLVNREEQPVDIAQAVQDNVARAAQMNPPTDASTVPVPPSPGQVRSQLESQSAAGHPPSGAGRDPIGDQVQSFGLAEIPAPKRVKVVSVRPDGTILPGDEAAAAPAPRQPAGKTSDRAGAVAKAATPKAVAVKTTSRVAAKPADQPADGIGQLAAGTEEAAPAKPARKPKPQRVASADAGDAPAAAAPVAEEGGGGFAVQLAAPGSEADAKAASTRLSKKFSDALNGHRIGFHKADSNGKSVFRVRVSSLSRAEAVSLCEKLKADGGSCFVAKN